MKQGTTPTLEFKLDIEISNVTEVYFTFTDELAYKGTSEDETASYLLQKNYPDDATFEDDVFKLPLTQEETDSLTNTFYVEAQVVCGTAVVKSDIKKVNMPHTLWTTYVDDNESDGQSEVIHLSFSDNVIVEGGGSSNYNDLTNKPRINNIELIGNKTTSDLGLDIEVGDGLKRVGNVVSVDLLNDPFDKSFLAFENGKLRVDYNELGNNGVFRNRLIDTNYNNALASKTYVDNLISGRLKRLVVQTLPTDNIDANTIYMILKSVPTTNNIYDEYMYINNAWELIGSTEVDLSNYYTKTESDTKYQPIIDSTHKVSADNIDDSTSTNKFVRIIKSTDTPPSSSSSSKYEVGTIWQKYSNSNFNLRNLTNVYVCKGHSNFATYPIEYQWEDITDHYSTGETDTLLGGKQNALTVGNGIDITSSTISAKIVSSGNILKFVGGELVVLGSDVVNDTSFKSTMPYDTTIRQALTTGSNSPLQPKLTAGTNITIDSNNVISASGGGLSYTFTDGLVESSGTVGIDLASGSKLLIDANDKLDVDLSSKQDTIDSTHKLSADLVTDTTANNKFVPSHSSTESGKVLGVDSNGDLEWTTKGSGGTSDYTDLQNKPQINSTTLSGNKTSHDLGLQAETTISTDTTSTTVSLTLADNHEYRYTQDLTSLTLTMPSGDFISSIVFASGSTPTSMTYDSSIKWSGDDITNGQFVPTEKTYNIVMWYDGLNINGVVRGV